MSIASELKTFTVVGLDLSINGSGCVKYTIDGDGEIIGRDWLSFHSLVGMTSDNDIYIRHKSTKTQQRSFPNKMEQNLKTTTMIARFCKGADLVGIEEYAFAGGGLDFDIAEFIGVIKHQLYLQGIPYKTYNITKIKQFGAGNGNATKDQMYNTYLEEAKSNPGATLADLWTHLTPGKHPHEDLVDAWWILQMATLEMGYIKGVFKEEDFRTISEKAWEVFFKDVRVKKKGKEAYFNPSVIKQPLMVCERMYPMVCEQLKSGGAKINGYEDWNAEAK